MIKALMVKPKNVDYISMLFLSNGKYFRNNKNYIVYQNPNTRQWVCVGQVGENLEVERFPLDYPTGRLISTFWDAVSIKSVIFLKNKQTINKIISGEPVQKDIDFTTMF